MEKLKIDFGSAVSQFNKAIKEFQIRKVAYKSLFRGKGLEFDGYRYFQSGDDDVSMIDWKASLRGNKLLAKQYIEERNLNIFFLVDASKGMLFGSASKLKAEYAAETIIALSNLMLNSNDNVGLVLFADKEVKVVMPSRTRNQMFLLMKYLSETGLYGKNFNLEGAVDFMLKTARDNAVIILVSDFIHMKRGFEKDLRVLATKFETFALMIRDPMDESLPRGQQLMLEDPHSGRQMLVDAAFAAERYRDNALIQKQAIIDTFRSLNVDLLELKTNSSFVIPLVSFLNARRHA